MLKRSAPPILLALLATAAFFANLGGTRLWDQDEAYFAGVAAEMHRHGEWIVPTFNGELFAHKPPFMYWMMSLGYTLFGQSEWSARAGSALFGVLTVLVTWRIGCRLFSPPAGFWAGIIMTGTLMFAVCARAATADCYLTFFATLAMYCFALGGMADGGPRRKRGPLLSPWMSLLLAYAAMSAGVLVKGPIGILLPCAGIGLYLMFTRPGKSSAGAAADASHSPPEPARAHTRTIELLFSIPSRFFRSLTAMRPWLAVPALLLIAAPWFVLVSLATGGEYLHEFVWVQHIERFREPMDNHRGPFWYYVPAVLAGFFPWSIFLVPATLAALARARRGGRSQAGTILLLCWIAAYLVPFSLAGTKLPSYVLPAYPALALLTARWVVGWSRHLSAGRVWMRLGWGSLIAVGVLMSSSGWIFREAWSGGRPLVDVLGVSSAFSREAWWLAGAGSVLIALGGAAWLLAEQGRKRWALPLMAVLSCGFITYLLAVAVLPFDRYQSSPPLAADIAERAAESQPAVSQYGHFRPSLVYYTEGRVDDCPDAAGASLHFARHRTAFLVTTDEAYPKIAPALPADVVILGRYSRFPKAGEVLLLGRRPLRTAAEGDNKLPRR